MAYINQQKLIKDHFRWKWQEKNDTVVRVGISEKQKIKKYKIKKANWALSSRPKHKSISIFKF